MDHRKCRDEGENLYAMTYEQYVQRAIHSEQHRRWEQHRHGVDDMTVPMLHLLTGSGQDILGIMVVDGPDALKEGIAQIRKRMVEQGDTIKAMVIGFDALLRKKGGDPEIDMDDLPEHLRTEALVIAAQDGHRTDFYVFEKFKGDDGDLDFRVIDEGRLPGGMKDDVLPLYDPSIEPSKPTSLFNRRISDVL